MKKIITALSILVSGVLLGQQTPADVQSKSILIVGATAHIGDGTIIKNSAIGFENGRITLVTTEDKVTTTFDTTIDGNGKHLYPGFIATNATLGLVEIDAVRASDDEEDLGEMIPHIRSLIAYNAESKVIESVRPNGVLMAQVTPRGGTLSGQSSVMQLDAWNWEDAAYKIDEGIHLNWPNPYTRGRWWLGEDRTLKTNKGYADKIKEIEKFFTDSKTYWANPSPKHLPFHAMEGVLEGEKTIYLHANNEKQIIDGISALKALNVPRIVLVGGNDAHLLTDFLKSHNVPVIISRPHRLPTAEDEDIKLPFRMAKSLMDEGILVSIDVSGSMERMNTRNLPFYAGSFAAYGLEKEKAVQLITGNAAKILNIDSSVGTLSVGKDATLFLSKGDALDMRTNILYHAFIQGRALSLETHQTKLWKRYSGKFARE